MAELVLTVEKREAINVDRWFSTLPSLHHAETPPGRPAHGGARHMRQLFGLLLRDRDTLLRIGGTSA